MLDRQPGRLAALWRRPILRVVLVTVVVLILWSFLNNQKSWATVAVVNATDEPLHDVTLVLRDGSGAEQVEQVSVLPPGGRWDHESPAALLQIVSLQFTRDDAAARYSDLGDVEAGQVVALTVNKEGGVRRSELYLSN